MKYQRKTKDVWFIIWNNEDVDEFEDRKEARAMLKEYNLAYNGGCSIKKKRVRIEE
jgi:hypothetical protein